jgi:hypothetical protein
MTDSKTKKPPARKNQASKYDKKNPGAYLPWYKWKDLNTEQQNAARESRKQDGIPSRDERQVSLLSTQGGNSEGTVDGNSEGTGMNDPGVDSSEDTPQSSSLKSSLKSIKQVPPELLVAPTVRFVETTQRNLHYANTSKARQIAKEIVKDAKASLPRKIGGLST